MKGVIGFSKTNSWISKAIRWFRGSEISHTFIIINDGDESGNLFVLEAGKRQVQITSYIKHYSEAKSYVELYQPIVNSKKITTSIDHMFRYLEKGYGYLQLLGLAVVSMLKKIGIKAKNPVGTGIICSELVRQYLLELDLEEFKKFDRDTVTPDELLKVVKNSNKFKRMDRPDE